MRMWTGHHRRDERQRLRLFVLLHEGGGTPLELLLRHVLLVRSNVPDVAEWILQGAGAVAVEFVLDRSHRLGALGDRAIPDGVDIVDIEIDRRRRPADGLWATRAHLGKLVG